MIWVRMPSSLINGIREIKFGRRGIFLDNDFKVFDDTNFFTTMVKIGNVPKDIFWFAIKLFLQRSDESFPLSSAIGGAQGVAKKY